MGRRPRIRTTREERLLGLRQAERKQQLEEKAEARKTKQEDSPRKQGPNRNQSEADPGSASSRTKAKEEIKGHSRKGIRGKLWEFYLQPFRKWTSKRPETTKSPNPEPEARKRIPNISPEKLPPVSTRTLTPFEGAYSGPIPSYETQFPETTGNQPLDVVIGLDWGTSCSKIALRTPFVGDKVYLVDFGSDGDSDNPYLLPSKLFLDRNGKGLLRHEDDVQVYPELKLNLLRALSGESRNGRDVDAQEHELASVYLALALQYARTWFIRTFYQTYRQYHIKWQVNLGIPAANFADNELCDAYAKVLHVAWWLSIQGDNVTIASAREAFELAENGQFSPGIHEDNLNLLPEVTAQVAGYAKSSLRRQGLHVLVDVGASTFDTAAFILHETEGEDRYSFLRAVVEPYGAYRLHLERVHELVKAGRQWFADEKTYELWSHQLRSLTDPMLPVHPDTLLYLPSEIRGRVTLPEMPDSTFLEFCRRAVHRILHEVRKRRDPHAPAWKNGLPIFLCGGGQHVPIYRRALEAVNRTWQQTTRVAPFEIRSIPTPANVIASRLPETEYHRISVAYGLSFQYTDIGLFRRPEEIPDVEMSTRTRTVINYEDTRELT